MTKNWKPEDIRHLISIRDYLRDNILPHSPEPIPGERAGIKCKTSDCKIFGKFFEPCQPFECPFECHTSQTCKITCMLEACINHLNWRINGGDNIRNNAPVCDDTLQDTIRRVGVLEDLVGRLEKSRPMSELQYEALKSQIRKMQKAENDIDFLKKGIAGTDVRVNAAFRAIAEQATKITGIAEDQTAHTKDICELHRRTDFMTSDNYVNSIYDKLSKHDVSISHLERRAGIMEDADRAQAGEVGRHTLAIRELKEACNKNANSIIKVDHDTNDRVGNLAVRVGNTYCELKVSTKNIADIVNSHGINLDGLNKAMQEVEGHTHEITASGASGRMKKS